MIEGIYKRKMGLGLIAIFIALLILPLFLSRHLVYVVASIVFTALLAMSLNLVFGYGGLLHLHFCIFYGIGAYTLALFLVKTSLPMWMGFIAAPLVAALGGWLTGEILVRLRGLYFGLLSIAIGQLAWSFARIGVTFTGGDFGIQNIRMPSILSSLNRTYYFILVVSGICLTILYLIVKSPFGRMLESTRDNPQRSESIGINVKTHRIIALVIASLVAGVSGALLVILERCVSPEVLFWSKSAQSLMMCLAGGMYVFWGPLAGAVLLTLLELFIGIYYAEYQAMILGIILVLVVIFLPQGVLGYIKEKFKPFFKDTLKET